MDLASLPGQYPQLIQDPHLLTTPWCCHDMYIVSPGHDFCNTLTYTKHNFDSQEHLVLEFFLIMSTDFQCFQILVTYMFGGSLKWVADTQDSAFIY